MSMFEKRPALRWIAPLALLAVVGGTGALATTASADPTLPPKSAEELLVDVQKAKVDGLSGTVVQKAQLGLPELPSTGSATTSDLTSLLSGNHMLKVWTAGPDKSRVAVLDRMAETDVVVNGSDVWTYSSQTNEATHRTLPKSDGTRAHRAMPDAANVPKTPQEAAAKVLAAVGPTTQVTTDASERVAKRDAYVLVLSPKDSGSLIGQVRIALDSETSVPLEVQALTQDGTVALDVGYTEVSFKAPDAGRFTWNTPAGAKVTEVTTPAAPKKAPSAADRQAAQSKLEQAKSDTKTVGQGWATVVVSKLPAGASSSGQLASFLTTLPRTSGTSVSGHVFAGPAFSAVVTDDGRIAVGAVQAKLLYDALAK
jgi:outer membrane lipoprotein-sorting protein